MKKFFVLSLLAVVSLFAPSVSVSAQTTATRTAQSSPRFSAKLTTSAPKSNLVLTNATTLPTGVAFSWGYAPNLPACPLNGTPVACQTGFTIQDTTANATVGNPTAIGPTALSFQYTPSTMFFGSHTFSLVANGYDSNGAPIQSTAATTVVTNNVTTINAPTGFTGATK